MNESTIIQILSSQPVEELVTLALTLAGCSSEARKYLLQFCEEKAEKKDKTSVAMSKARYQWERVQDVLYGDYEGYDPDGEIQDAFECLEDLMKENRFPWEERKELLQEMLQEMQDQDDGGRITDYLTDCLASMVRTKSEKLYLAKKLEGSSDEEIVRLTAKLYLEAGRDEDFLRIQKENLDYESDYITLVEYLKSKGKTDEAIALLQDAISHFQGRTDEMFVWLFREYEKQGQEGELQNLYEKTEQDSYSRRVLAQMMYEHYPNDYEKRKRYLLELFRLSQVNDAGMYYEKCRDELLDKDFKSAKKELESLLREKSPAAYIEVMLESGQKKKALACLQEEGRNNVLSGYADRGHRFSAALKMDYPDEIAELYWNECEKWCSVGGRDAYEMAVWILKDIKGLYDSMGKRDEWGKQYAAFRERNKRKRILKEILEKEKL